MRKTAAFTLALILITALSLSSVTFAMPKFDDSVLSVGDYGDDVTALQTELHKLGLYTGSITGVYDTSTALAVRVLQKMLGVKPDGVFGPLTFSAYNEALRTGVFSYIIESKSDNHLPLAGKLIGIDPGHQAVSDTELEPLAPYSERTKERQSAGGVGVKTGIYEYEITLQIALKLKAIMEAQGASVVMTRTTSTVSISNAERAELMNGFKVDAWVRLHCDSSTSSRTHGVNVLVPARYFNNGIYNESMRLGKALLSAFCEATGASSLEVVPLTDQTGFNWSKYPVAAIEMGYLTNPQEDVRLSRDSYQYLCASGICDGLLAFFKSASAEE